MKSTGQPLPENVLPTTVQLTHAQESLYHTLPPTPLGLDALQDHISQDITPGLNASSQSSRYYGFVTGGVTPAAKYADTIVTEHDQNVQVHLPNETVATDVEAAALDLLCDLLDLSLKEWSHRTFTTGATASNIIGLACGREHVIAAAAARTGKTACVSSMGLPAAMRAADLDDIQILTTAPHSSLRKATSIIGLGHQSVKDIGLPDQPHRIDFAALEKALSSPRTASIISISCSEVNSGLFATSGPDMSLLRTLADTHNAWLHIDAAFGLLARILPSSPEYSTLLSGVSGLQHADSIAGDAHKLFNVPYDCGILFSKHISTATSVFQNPGAPYLTTSAASIPSPLNIGIENSRRFRALPVYANLVAYSRSGFQAMLGSQIRLARTIAAYLLDSPHYELLPPAREGEKQLESIYIIVLFRAKDEKLNDVLVSKINESKRIYVSGTKWDGTPACRFAVSNWRAGVEEDWDVVREVLDSVAAGGAASVES